MPAKATPSGSTARLQAGKAICGRCPLEAKAASAHAAASARESLEAESLGSVALLLGSYPSWLRRSSRQLVRAVTAHGDRHRLPGSGHEARCTPLAVWLKLWSAVVQLARVASTPASPPLPPLGNRPSTPFLERRAPAGTCLRARLCVHTVAETQPSVETGRAWRPRGDRDHSADQLPSQPPPFPLPATTPQQCCANPPHHHHQAREGCAATGRRPCLVVLRVVCINDSWAKKRKNRPISNPRNNRFSPPCGGLGGKRRLPHEFCTL